MYVCMWSSNSFSRRKFLSEFATPAVTLENYTYYLHTGAIYIFNPVASSFMNVRIAYCTYIHRYMRMSESGGWNEWTWISKMSITFNTVTLDNVCLMTQCTHIQNIQILSALQIPFFFSGQIHFIHLFVNTICSGKRRQLMPTA